MIQQAIDTSKQIPLGDLPQFLYTQHSTRAAWLTARMNCIGASDSAAVLGCGYANQSLMSVYYSKVHGESEEEVAKRLKIGKLIEPSLRAIFSMETGLPCENPGEFRIYRHRQYDWLGATLDGLTVHPEYGVCTVELKNVDEYMKHEWKDEEAPLKFTIQTQQQLAVTGCTHSFLMGLIGGNKPEVRIVPRDDEFIELLIKRLEWFWGFVQRRELPPIDGSEITGKVLGKMFNPKAGKTICLPAEAKTWAEEYEKSKEEESSAKKRKDEYGNRLKAAIGDATFGEIPGGGLYSYKLQRNKGYTVEPFECRVLRKVEEKKG